MYWSAETVDNACSETNFWIWCRKVSLCWKQIFCSTLVNALTKWVMLTTLNNAENWIWPPDFSWRQPRQEIFFYEDLHLFTDASAPEWWWRDGPAVWVYTLEEEEKTKKICCLRWTGRCSKFNSKPISDTVGIPPFEIILNPYKLSWSCKKRKKIICIVQHILIMIETNVDILFPSQNTDKTHYIHVGDVHYTCSGVYVCHWPI